MRQYAASGRHGKVNVRHFRNVMTHAVDIDGMVWKFFSSAADADAYAAEKSAEGYDAVVVPAWPYFGGDDDVPGEAHAVLGAAGSDPSMDATTFAALMHGLFELHPRTAEELADELREQGVIMATEVARRLLTGSAGIPSDSTIEAITRVFDVEADYFDQPTAAGPYDVGYDGPASAHQQHSTPIGDTRFVDRLEGASSGASHVIITIQESGRIIAGLSEAANRCLALPNSDVGAAVRLTRALAAVGSEVGRADESDVSLPRPVLEEVFVAWASTGPSVSSERSEYLWAAELLGRPVR